MDDLDDWLDREAGLAALQGVCEGGALDQPLSACGFEGFADGQHIAEFDDTQRIDSKDQFASVSPFAGLSPFPAHGGSPGAAPACASPAPLDAARGHPSSSSRFASLPHYTQRAELGPLQLPDDGLPRAFSTPAPGLIGGGDGPFGGAMAFGADVDCVVDTASKANATAAAETAAERPTRARSPALTSAAIPEAGSKALLGPDGGGGRALGRSSSRAAALMPAVPRAAATATAGSSGGRRCSGGRNLAAGRPTGGGKGNGNDVALGLNNRSSEASAALLAKAAELGVSPKRMKRILANRRSAAAAKARKAEYHRDLEREVQELRRRVADIDAVAHHSNERGPDAGTSSGSGQAAAGSANMRSGRGRSRKQRSSMKASPASPGDVTDSDGDDCMPEAAPAAREAEESAELQAELTRQSAELAAARRYAVTMMQRAQRAEAAQAELSSRVAEMDGQLRAAAVEIPRLRAALRSARAAAAGAVAVAATAGGAALQGGGADVCQQLQGGPLPAPPASQQQQQWQQPPQRQPVGGSPSCHHHHQQQQQQHDQQPPQQQQPPPMQLTASGGLRPFLPLSALIAQRWGAAGQSAVAFGAQKRHHSLPSPGLPPQMMVATGGTAATGPAVVSVPAAASAFPRPGSSRSGGSGGGSTADGDAFLRIGSDGSTTLPAPGGSLDGAPGGPPAGGDIDVWAFGLQNIAMMYTDRVLSDMAPQQPPMPAGAAHTGKLAAMSASFSSMTAFGSSGELQQGPGVCLSQLQPGQSGAAAAAAIDAAKREPSPWRPAAGSQPPGVGLTGYDSQNSLLRELGAERARHATWQQAQWAEQQHAPAGGGAAGWSHDGASGWAAGLSQQQPQQPLQGFLDLPAATPPPL